MTINKAVFPVAGLGTRFLPATKATPKEMLPIVDKPLIQYAVEEAIQAGITELIFVTNSNKRAIEDHFDSNFELESTLAKRDKLELLAMIKNIIPEGVKCAYVRQSEALGLGHALLSAKHLLDNQPFAVLLADDLIDDSSDQCMQSLVTLYSRHNASAIAVTEIDPQETHKYGIISPQKTEANVSIIKHIVEKPLPEAAPSNLAAIGRYVFTPEILDVLEDTPPDNSGEIQLTDAIATLLDRQKVYAYNFQGTRFDCGSKLGYLHATVTYGLTHPEVSTAFSALLKETIKKLD